MKDIIRLDINRNNVAKNSKNNLVTEIEKFTDDGNFLEYHTDYINIDYGFFSCKTKTRPLDDIDIMIVLHAQVRWREEIQGGYRIRAAQ
ncbi:hypothetical protein [Flavobacterium sp.]